ncbi:hypothetical protein [Cytobacillus gottheilii]|nr:hypothetical protein [Cytobacillus gottheilii]
MNKTYQLLLKSTLLSSFFSLIILILTIYHHIHIDQLLRKLTDEKKHSS